MDRGINDEAFVGRALEEADFDTGRSLADQAAFNLPAARILDPVVKAAVITAVAVYREKYDLPAHWVSAALAINTCGDARALIDQVEALLPRISRT